VLRQIKECFWFEREDGSIAGEALMDARSPAHHESATSKWSGVIRSPLSWLVTIGIGLVGLYLLAIHTGHVLGALPYLLLLTCPLMHLFMHRSHDGHGGDGR
jgi:Protein of unknown function (DUF2933)